MVVVCVGRTERDGKTRSVHNDSCRDAVWSATPHYRGDSSGGVNKDTRMNDRRITVSIRFEDVEWARVLDILVGRSKRSFLVADRALHDFFKRFFRLLNLEWFRNRPLSSNDNTIATALCELHSADTVVIRHSRPVRVGPLQFDYTFGLALTPQLGRQARGGLGASAGRIELCGFGRRVVLERTSQIVVAQGCVAVGGVVCYVLLATCLLYGMSVLWQFHRSPVETLIAATTRLDIGVALLAVAIGIAGLFGRIFRNLYNLSRDLLRRDPGRGEDLGAPVRVG